MVNSCAVSSMKRRSPVGAQPTIMTMFLDEREESSDSMGPRTKAAKTNQKRVEKRKVSYGVTGCGRFMILRWQVDRVGYC